MKISGHAKFGSSFCDIIPSQVNGLQENRPWVSKLLELFEKEKFVVWTQPSSSPSFSSSRSPQFHILLKEGHTPADHLKAWAFACDLASLTTIGTYFRNSTALVEEMCRIKGEFDTIYNTFVEDIKRVGWDVEASALVSGSPRVITLVDIEPGQNTTEDRKSI